MLCSLCSTMHTNGIMIIINDVVGSQLCTMSIISMFTLK